MSRFLRPPRRRIVLLPLLLVVAMAGSLLVPMGHPIARGDSPPGHIVISEIVTGGTSASDEFVELYNPTGAALPLEGLELIYVSASGLTVGRRAAWELGASQLDPGRHLLIANELGIYASIADVTYVSGLAATGGSIALRIQGASTAVDALGWGSVNSTWLEGTPAPAPAAGASLERLPGGAAGSGQDTDDNAADFMVRDVPDPQNLGSPPVPDPTAPTLSPAPSTSPSATPSPTPTATPPASPIPTPQPPMTIGQARAAVDGTTVTVEGVALTGSAFAEGGGYLADETGGIAVLLSSGTFERGNRLRVTGTVDNRFAQRTIRASDATLQVLGPGTDPDPLTTATGSVAEPVEGRLVRVSGVIAGAPTALTAGPAYDLDDGSGPIRVLVATATGIDTGGWSTGARVNVIGVVGQRDSSGTGTAGYRLQPRDPADVISLHAPDPTEPSASPSGSVSPTPSASPPDGVITIAAARETPKGTRVTVRGIVTMPPGVVDPVSAVIQDATGAIVLRVGDEIGPIVRGERIEIQGTRSTLAGMETLRVSAPARRLGMASEPEPLTVRTGDAGEGMEARLVRVRGAVVASARRIASGTVSFEIDDGSGPIRVFQGGSLGADPSAFTSGAWVEAVGVLGQETTGAQPLRGYRVWPRTADEVRVVSPQTDADSPSDGGGGSSDSGAGSGLAPATLEALEEADLADLRVGATLVHGPWRELGVGGLLWDGDRLVGIHPASEPRVRALVARHGPPVMLELSGLVARGRHAELEIPLVRLGAAPGDVTVVAGAVHAPTSVLAEEPAWVALVGRLRVERSALLLTIEEASAEIGWRCKADDPPRASAVRVLGIGTSDPDRVLVGCGGVRLAPTLVRGPSAVLAAQPHRSERGEDPARAMSDSASPDGSRVGSAGLLALGALILVGGAVLARRLDHGPDPEPGSEPATVPSDGDPEPAAPPVLTLVAVPHERGSG